LLSTLATPSNKIRDAVLPRIVSREYEKTYCSSLKQVVQELNGVNPGDLETRPMRTRYWWGARAVYSYSLRFFNVYQTREMIRNLTSLAYLGLAISLLYLSTSLFWVALPLLIFGTLFSGITYYSEIVLGTPYLWALIAPILLAFLHIKNAPDALKYLSVFAIGMVSSFLWLLEGHILLLATWIILIAYFSALRTMNAATAILSVVKHGFAYAGGFFAAVISGQFIKILYVGVSPVVGSMSKAIAHRSSDVAPGGVDLDWSIVMEKVWGIGYWWTGLLRHELLWNLLITASIAAAILGMVIGLIRGVKGHWLPMVSVLVCAAIVAMIFSRLFFTQNHVVIHAFFIGRYMFIPLAMGWAMLIVSLYKPGSGCPGLTQKHK
jgi:hypothetical protein